MAEARAAEAASRVARETDRAPRSWGENQADAGSAGRGVEDWGSGCEGACWVGVVRGAEERWEIVGKGGFVVV